MWQRSHAIRISATIFLSAFLLFQVQPMMGRFVLPWFGGGPAVWTNCLLFFQAFLLAGPPLAGPGRRSTAEQTKHSGMSPTVSTRHEVEGPRAREQVRGRLRSVRMHRRTAATE